MKNRTFCISVPFVFASLLILALTVVVSPPASAQPAAPQKLRVDISDGTTGQLLVTWSEVTAAYYNVWRSTSPNGPWATVADCNGPTFNPKPVPANTIICRDNNGGSGLPVTTPLTYYYYQVQACDRSGACTYATPQPPLTSAPGNTPVTCNCSNTGTNPQIPPTPRTPPPNPLRLPTTSVIPSALDQYPYAASANEFAAYANPVLAPNGLRHILLVVLPGSGSTCSLSGMMYTAENLGFDGICVNYDNQSEQETICSGHNLKNPNYSQTQWETAVANCFGNISQSKLDFTGDCTQTLPNGMPNPGWMQANCGIDPSKSNGPYYVANQYDAVFYRITTLLYYLWCTTDNKGGNYDTANTHWENYLALAEGATCANTNVSNLTPNWGQLMLGGWSQGGDLSTFAASEHQVQRAINLSAPPQAVVVGSTEATEVMTAASYFAAFANNTSATEIRNIYGLVSVNDTTHYDPPKLKNNTQPSVYTAVWTALGYFIPGNDDQELKLNQIVNNQMTGLSCSGTPSNNFSTYPLQSVGGGHADTLYIWNEDIFKFMLIDQ